MDYKCKKMKRSVQLKTTFLHEKVDNSQLIDLNLIDESTNVEYILKIQKEVYNRAHNDVIFATTLLEKAKTLLNSKDIHRSVSSINMENISRSNITVGSNDTIDTTSDTENVSDTPDTDIR
ncbi:uncharacterized protein LOC109861958 isoform X2 [Pseudomyrmex gracilis]|uniref:uncharacterized protein LOC109861958 isoform X2 n=1 Tax=Pseudomyrmex gracilis TaxID=219809 RepID=UPI000995C66A|nr:uncharacterized protein LOC109861958 isoform X2 [Pseudomyrmex gracilis]